jgi:hypothetical protein
MNTNNGFSNRGDGIMHFRIEPITGMPYFIGPSGVV